MPEPATRLKGSLGERVATRYYAIVKRTRLLENTLSGRAFLGVYGLYKRYGGDPYQKLVQTRPRLFSGGHILDIGANVGYTASVFTEALTGDSRVFAFEPEPWSFSILDQLADRSHGRITAIRSAVGKHVGEAWLALNDIHPAGHRIAIDGEPSPEIARRKALHVPMTTVDAFLEERAIPPHEISFIKIDVQGYESHVIEGMQRTLEAARRLALSFEYDPQMLEEEGMSGTTLLRDLFRRGYSQLYLLRSRRAPVGITTEELHRVMRARPYLDLLSLREDHVL